MKDQEYINKEVEVRMKDQEYITLTDYDIIVKNPIGMNQMMKYKTGVGWVVNSEREWNRISLNKKIKKVKNVKE